MSKFVRQSAEYQNRSVTWLEELQTSANQAWQTLPFPNRKTENWRYTNLKKIEQSEYLQASEKHDDTAGEISIFEDGPTIAVVNGCVNFSLSKNLENLEAGLEIVSFAQANSEQQKIIKQYVNQVVFCSEEKKYTFASLNMAKFEDGLLVHVKNGAQLTQPIQIQSITIEEEKMVTSQHRVLVVVEQHAQATVLESFEGQGASLMNAICEIYAHDSSHIDHYRVHSESISSNHIGGIHVRLEAHANYNGFLYTPGTDLTRVDVVVHHTGEAAHCQLNGIFLPQGNNHVDIQTCIEHAVAHCTTDETFRGIVGDQAKAVFNGRIHIHPDAQKTLANLSIKNLLSSDKAEVNAKPELEIYADDVRCAHGATVAQLDDEALHYFKTRGINDKNARRMLSFGFINELINGIQHDDVAQYIRAQITTKFDVGNVIEVKD